MKEGWQVGDLARNLICLAAATNLLTLKRPDRFEGLRKMDVQSQISACLDEAPGT